MKEEERKKYLNYLILRYMVYGNITSKDLEEYERTHLKPIP